MGQKQSPEPQPVTLQLVQKSIGQIFDDQQVKFNPIKIALPLQYILQNLSENIPAQKTQQGFVLNFKMVKIFYHEKFLFAMGKLINLLLDKLEENMRKSLLMINKDEWKFCCNLANFIIFFTDDKLIRMIETVGVRSDLSEHTKAFIQGLEKQGRQVTATQSLIDKLSYSQIQRIQKCLRISLNQLISMRTQVITRSQQTLKVIQKLQEACFILYLKALYSPQHSQTILNKAKHPQHLKSNLIIAHYFLGRGADLSLPCIYESAVLLLTNLLEKNSVNLREIKSLPSHLFKTLPIISQPTVYDFVIVVGLWVLTYVKENNNLYCRFACNRLMTLKLMDLMVKDVKVSSAQITYYLEEICLQTRIGMIQRSFVTDLVQNYINLVQKSIQHAKTNPPNQPTASSSILPSIIKPNPQQSSTSTLTQSTKSIGQFRFSKQDHASQILLKYLTAGKQQYNIKYSNKKFKITTVDVITELENDQTVMQTEFRIICEKYIYEVVLGKRVVYQYNDRQIWNEILPKILEDISDGSDGGKGSGDEDENTEKQIPSANNNGKQLVRQQQPQKSVNQSQKTQNKPSESQPQSKIPITTHQHQQQDNFQDVQGQTEVQSNQA